MDKWTLQVVGSHNQALYAGIERTLRTTNTMSEHKTNSAKRPNGHLILFLLKREYKDNEIELIQNIFHPNTEIQMR